jgi:hypothetical protein
MAYENFRSRCRTRRLPAPEARIVVINPPVIQATAISHAISLHHPRLALADRGSGTGYWMVGFGEEMDWRTDIRR